MVYRAVIWKISNDNGTALLVAYLVFHGLHATSLALPLGHNIIPTVDAQRVRIQLDRVLSSSAFADAERASSFLRFIVERKLDGRAVEIKESVIAMEVLGRTPSFDSKSDPIVRVEAGRLRDRLDSYYQSEGGEDPVLIALPKGRYIPEFTERRTREASKSAAVLRLSVLPPENTSFESFTVSPDGRKLAFTAVLNGRVMLWVRALDSLEAKPLAGTDNAQWPFWSPDSLSIAFFEPHKLKVVEVSGGPAREIADLVHGRGGAWSPEGVILFCPRPIGILYQVPAAGGVPSPVTTLDESRAEVMHGFPQFLPGGRQFLYLAASSRPGASSIRAGSLESTTSKVLLSGDTSAAYAPLLRGQPASLLFLHDGALMAQAFDSQRLELHGERTVIVPDVRYRRWGQARFSISSNGVLLYQSGRPESRQLAWFDRQGKLLSAAGSPNDYLSFSLCLANSCSGRDGCLVQTTTMWLPAIGLELGASGFRRFDWRLPIQASVSSMPIVIVPEGTKFYFQVRFRPEQQMI